MTLLAIDSTRLTTRGDALIKAREFSALLDAHEIVQSARRHLTAAHARAEVELEQARRSGYEEGMRQARADLSALIVQTKADVENAFIALEGRIVQTVLSAVKQVLGTVDDRALLEPSIRRVILQAKNEQTLRLRVCTAQFDAANAAVAAVLKEFPDVEWIDVVNDPAAPHGACVLESDLGVIDGSLETQLAALRRGLLNSFVERRLASDLKSED
jgi:type III secretion protein L